MSIDPARLFSKVNHILRTLLQDRSQFANTLARSITICEYSCEIENGCALPSECSCRQGNSSNDTGQQCSKSIGSVL